MIVVVRKQRFLNGAGAFAGYLLILWVFFPALFWVLTITTAMLIAATFARHATRTSRARHRA